MLQEGKKSKLTDEHMQKLEAAGFEFTLFGGSTRDEEEKDDEMVVGHDEEETTNGKV